MGAEVTTREEVHCLAFFENEDQLETFQGFLDTNLPDIANDVDRFGYQVVVDADENIIFQEERLLTSALLRGIDEVEAMVHELEGLFIPAHVDKSRNSIFSQLGFLPPALRVDAIEVSPFCNQEKFRAGHSELAGYPIISGSDAHHLNQLGTRVTYIESERADFNSIRKLFHGKWQGKIKVLN
jgi:PHP family Zn ribbon phosphoesterase